MNRKYERSHLYNNLSKSIFITNSDYSKSIEFILFVITYNTKTLCKSLRVLPLTIIQTHNKSLIYCTLILVTVTSLFFSLTHSAKIPTIAPVKHFPAKAVHRNLVDASIASINVSFNIYEK